MKPCQLLLIKQKYLQCGINSADKVEIALWTKHFSLAEMDTLTLQHGGTSLTDSVEPVLLTKLQGAVTHDLGKYFPREKVVTLWI